MLIFRNIYCHSGNKYLFIIHHTSLLLLLLLLLPLSSLSLSLLQLLLSLLLFVWGIHERKSPWVHWQWGKFQLWANCFMYWRPIANHWPQSLTGNSATHHCVERANHSPMTHPSERISTSHMLSHTQQRVDSGQERIFTGMLTPGIGISTYHFCVEETWEHISVPWEQDKFQIWAKDDMRHI